MLVRLIRFAQTQAVAQVAPAVHDAGHARACALAQADHQKHLLHSAVAAIAHAALHGLLRRHAQAAGVAQHKAHRLLDHQHRQAPRVIRMHQRVHQRLAQRLVRVRVVLANIALEHKRHLDVRRQLDHDAAVKIKRIA